MTQAAPAVVAAAGGGRQPQQGIVRTHLEISNRFSKTELLETMKKLLQKIFIIHLSWIPIQDKSKLICCGCWTSSGCGKRSCRTPLCSYSHCQSTQAPAHSCPMAHIKKLNPTRFASQSDPTPPPGFVASGHASHALVGISFDLNAIPGSDPLPGSDAFVAAEGDSKGPETKRANRAKKGSEDGGEDQDWLPAGWTVTTKTWAKGATAGHVDRVICRFDCVVKWNVI